MGTRSLCGYMMENGMIHCQYMQFDGVPSTKGREFYEGVIRPVANYSKDFYTEQPDSRPTPEFFKLVRRFLDYYQYESPHSIGAQTKEKIEDFLSSRDLYDSEWRYLFDRDGNFTMMQVGGWKVVIPWKFTLKMIQVVGRDFHGAIKCEHKHGWGDFWERISHGLSEGRENAKVIKWSIKEALLHVSDKFDYESSKELLELIVKGGKPSILYPVVLSLEYATREDKDGKDLNGRLLLNGEVVLENKTNSTGKIVNKGCLKVVVK